MKDKNDWTNEQRAKESLLREFFSCSCIIKVVAHPNYPYHAVVRLDNFRRQFLRPIHLHTFK